MYMSDAVQSPSPQAQTHPANPGRGTPEKAAGAAAAFSRFCTWSAQWMGSPQLFAVSLLLIVVWGATGPLYHYSDTWQLIINTATNLITFVMVFLIQNTQNRDSKAINLKLNEIIHSMQHAHNELIDIERLSDEELRHFDDYYQRIREEAERRRGQSAKPAA